MKKLFLLLLALLSVAFFSCKKDNDSDNGGDNNGNYPCSILKLVDDLEEYLELTFTYNNQDQMIRMDSWEDDYHDYKTMQYDNNGNMIRIEYYDEDGMYSYQTFEFSNGKVTKGTEYTYAEFTYIYHYNSTGKLERIELHNIKSLLEGPGQKNDSPIPSGLLSAHFSSLISKEMSKGSPKRLNGAEIKFQWNSSGNVIKETWSSGETVLENYDFSYDNKVNPYVQYRLPVPIVGGAYSNTISANNYTKQSWYSEINGSTETTDVSYEYNGNGYPVSIIFDDSDKYRIEYHCD